MDSYRRNRITGSFILLDPLTNETLGAGMIEAAVAGSGNDTARAASIHLADNPDMLWTLARMLVENGHRVVVLSTRRSRWARKTPQTLLNCPSMPPPLWSESCRNWRFMAWPSKISETFRAPQP
ncbi:MAG: hypothetical protein WDO73_32880 [Ignavibacteriota bacterium]